MPQTNRELSRRDVLGGSALALAGIAAAACAPGSEEGVSAPDVEQDAPRSPDLSDAWSATP